MAARPKKAPRGKPGPPRTYFLVSGGPNNTIRCNVQRNDVPPTLLTLKSDVEAAHSTIKILYADPDSLGKLEAAHGDLLGLAQVGLSGPNPAPQVARAALETLKLEIVDREAGRIKNRYLIRLGAWALLFGGILLVLRALLEVPTIAWPAFARADANLSLLVAGSMVGTWLSFGARKTVLTFEDLKAVEDDRLEPWLRLIFTGLLTLLLGLMVMGKLFDLAIGEFKALSLTTVGENAFLLGAICGLSEKVLPRALLKRASSLIQGLYSKT